MSRAAEAIIDTRALAHNLQVAKHTAPSRRVYSVIKANGYGHGMVAVANALHDSDGFAVASIEEALTLREANITKPILLLEGFFDASELDAIYANKLEIALHHLDQLQALSDRALKPQSKKITLWLKVDTGMHRLGLSPEKVTEAYQQATNLPQVESVVLMTHLANADDRADHFTSVQVKRFQSACDDLDGPKSIANSAGILAWPETHADIIRPGIMLYGASPFAGGDAQEFGLRPVMTLQTRLIAVKTVKKGEPVGYGGTWRCPQDMPIGVAAIGYGDGYPRHVQNGTPVLVNGARCALVGRVSMDMICIDLRTMPNAKVGDSVILWGNGLPIEEIATSADTIAYELFCGVTQRVTFQVI
jgi:alanine racemase